MCEKQVRAIYDEKTIRVYQAYTPEIALPALEAGKFVAPFKMNRMTWIKPSFCWMMYRSGYASKQGQEVVLAIDILREGFDWALENAAMSSFGESHFSEQEAWKSHLESSSVRAQWDPERDIMLDKISNLKAIQLGLSNQVVKLYVNEWIHAISDITHVAKRANENSTGVQFPCSLEKPYPVSTKAKFVLGM